MCKLFTGCQQLCRVISTVAMAVIAICSVVSTVFIVMGSQRLHHLKPLPEDADTWVRRNHADSEE